MTTRRPITCGALVAASLLVAPAATSAASTAPGHRTTSPTSFNESAALKRVRWTTNVVVAFGNGSWTFKSNGLPAKDFEAPDYAVPSNPLAVDANGATVIASSSALKDQSYDYTLPLVPRYSTRVTTTNQGPIGFLLDGAALYNPYEANHATVATADNFDATSNGVTASFLDSCDGHPGPGGQYHYHGLPSCLVAYATGAPFSVTSVTALTTGATPAVAETAPAARKPVVLGFAFDGYAIYDNVAMNGRFVPVRSLDACNGITSPVPGYPHGVYHYVLENVKGTRSSIGCYHGIVSSAYTEALQNTLGAGGPPPRPQLKAHEIAGAATAQRLAADPAYDAFLQSVLEVSTRAAWC